MLAGCRGRFDVLFFVLVEYSSPMPYVAFRQKGRFIEKFYNVRHRVMLSLVLLGTG